MTGQPLSVTAHRVLSLKGNPDTLTDDARSRDDLEPIGLIAAR
jgi:hypothetical protein